MKIALFILCATVISYVMYDVARMSGLVTASRTLVRNATPFARVDGTTHLLVLGDSTAVGVGADAAASVPGRLAKHLRASVENHSKSGARAGDIMGQLEQTRRYSYDLVLIQVGANDVIKLRSLRKAEKSLDEALAYAKDMSPRVLILTGGKIGDAPFFSPLLRPLMNARAADLRERFMRIAEKHDAVYVDIFSRSSPFEDDPARYYASDKLHLSPDGYGYWFEIVREEILKRWPDFGR